MIVSTTLKRRMIVGGFFGTFLAAFVVIGLAGSGRIPPEPTLGIVGFLSGAVTFSIMTWRWARRNRAGG